MTLSFIPVCGVTMWPAASSWLGSLFVLVLPLVTLAHETKSVLLLDMTTWPLSICPSSSPKTLVQQSRTLDKDFGAGALFCCQENLSRPPALPGLPCLQSYSYRARCGSAGRVPA